MQATVKAEDLARILGLSDAAVRQLARRGIVIKAGRAEYDLEESVRSYCAHLRSLATGRKETDGPGAGRARLAKAQCAALEQKMAIQRGSLLDAGEVEREWSGVLRTVRAGIMRIPRRAGNRLGLAPDGVRLLDDECRDVLKTLAENGAVDG